MRLLPVLVTAAVLGLLPAVAQARVSTAPGSVVIRVDDGSVQQNVDAGGVSHAIALPDGSTLLFGSGAAGRTVLYATKIARDGALDASFGDGGVLAFPAPGGATFGLRQILRQSDGKLLFVSAGQTTLPRFEPAPLQVTRVNADFSLDRSYGVDGTRVTPVGEGCGGACTPAALAPDGSLVLTGANGEARPPAAPASRWTLARLTPSGALDTGFGAGGLATIATPAGTATGFNVAFGPGGTIVAEGQLSAGGDARLLLTRLSAGGAPDPSFGGGVPIVLPLFSGFGMFVQGDGSVVLSGSLPGTTSLLFSPRPERLVRFTATGAPDPAFGAGGYVDLGSEEATAQILPSSGGWVLVLSGATGERHIRLVAPNGAIATTSPLNLPFGGGGSSFLVSIRPRLVGPLLQNSFTGDQLVRRPDGTYLVAGAVKVSQPTGEGTGFSIGRFAVTALTPAVQPDTTFGGPRAPLRLSVRLARQRASTARTRHGIRISLKASEVGLAKVRITHGGRLIAHSLLPVFGTTRRTLPVELTTYGKTYLRRHRNVRVSVAVSGRDVLTNRASATARGRLR